MIANDKNRFRWVVLGLPQDGACIDLFENHSKNSLKEDLSNITTFNPLLFSLVNIFKRTVLVNRRADKIYVLSTICVVFIYATVVTRTYVQENEGLLFPRSLGMGLIVPYKKIRIQIRIQFWN